MQRIRDYFSPIKLAARRFRKNRADYYEYLADVLSDSNGRILLHDLFTKDSNRYAGDSFWRKISPHPRAVLSAYWASKLLHTGANLADTWRGTLPDGDMLIISPAVKKGGTGALPESLREVARIVRVMEEARNIFLSIITAAIFGIIIVIITLSIIPMVAWPAIKEAFDFIPISYYGPNALSMESFSKAYPKYFGPILISVFSLAYLYKWSLKKWKGKARQWADKLVIYRVYKTYRGAMFLATLAPLVKNGSGLNLREAIETVSKEAEPWLKWYCDKILENLDLGMQDASLFDVGLLETDALYYLLDMSEAKELETGLKITGTRAERDMGKTIKLRAFVLRWSILFASLFIVAFMLFQTFMSIKEMNDAAKLVFL